MKRKVFFGASIAAALVLTSCGGGEAEGEEGTSDSTATTVEEEVEAMTYDVDTAQSTVSWMTYEGEEIGHTGSVKVSGGSFSTEGDAVTGGSLTFNMASVVADSDKLTGHLMAPDFFDLANFATAEFSFGGYAEGVVSGTLSMVGQEFNVEANTAVDGNVLNVSEFKIDASSMNFFVSEREEKAEEEWHDANVGVTATIVGVE